MSKVFKYVDKETNFVTPYNDLSKYNYTRSWDQGLTENIYGYDVKVPDMPPEDQIINFGKPISEQIFRKTLIPKDLILWSEKEQDEFISREHHRRVHGLWFFIKGKPIYIPGIFYFFMNYWTGETKRPLSFRIGDWKFFMIWMHVVLTPWIHGLIDFKCRRIGDTEKAMCIMYEYASRVRNTINQMYDCRIEKDIKATFTRFKKSHREMIWFMKPILPGNDDPADTMSFKYPSKKIDVKSFVDNNGDLQEFEFEQIDSEVNYQTNSSGPDGKRIGRLYVDEFGKSKQINPIELWDLGKKALEDDYTEEIIGKALFTSTIEDMNNGKALEISKKLWDMSNPEETFNNQTTSGLIRVVRGALDRAKTDRWGYVDEEDVLRKIKEKQQDLINKREWITLIKHKRQNCITIQDVFSNISEGSPFNIDNISNRLNELLYSDNQIWVRGNFQWVDGKRPIAGDPNGNNKECKVEFIPESKSGRLVKIFDPEDFGLKSNNMSRISIKPKPGNINYFSMGIDPVSYSENLEEGKQSFAGLSVKRILDHTIDIPTASYTDDGKPIDGGRYFKTNRYCCFYKFRHQKPSDNYNDWLMTMIYYGTDFRIEKNHGAGFLQYLEIYGFLNFYEENIGMKNAKGQEEKFGQTASDKVIQAYFGALTELTNDWHNTIDAEIALEELSTMEYITRTKHDLGVSMGFCELSANNKIKKVADKIRRENEEQQEFEWTEEEYY